MMDNDNNRTVPNALPVGYRFNEFEIKEVIGGGGFGIVYRAWDHQLERTIAIKEFMPASLAVRGDDMTLVLRSERFGKAFSAGLNSFIQEARLLARFNHPNLLHVLRFWVQNDTAYMGTLFYSGTTLSRLREQKPEMVNEAWIRRMLPMLFGAIKTIHDEGYLHRDISLDNIQIQDNEFVRQLQYKGEWAGRSVVAIDPFFPSSKRCSCCGFTMEVMPLDVRKWHCPDCGVDHDRDVNAARNIKAAGLAVLAHGEPVNPELHRAAQVRLSEVGILAL